MKVFSFKILAVLMTAISVSAQAESLSEAVQTSLISNPEAIFSASAVSAAAASSNIYTNLALNSSTTLKPKVPSSEDLAFEAVKSYLQVILNEKILQHAQTNLRVAQKSALKMRLKQAEIAKLEAEKELEQAKKSYAHIVGHWPEKLIWPRTPTNHDLPVSINEALEQAFQELSNYSSKSLISEPYYLRLSNSGSLPEKIKLQTKPNSSKQSFSALSAEVRDSWSLWTKTGLDLIAAKRKLALASQQKNQRTDFFEKQKAYLKTETQEIIARYRILKYCGRLVSYINTFPPKTDLTEERASLEASLLSEMDKMSFPYPDYKPLFRAELSNEFNSSLGLNFMDKAVQFSSTSLAWYISAGTFKNKANALALITRLSSLGFMPIMRTLPEGASVFIGPYDLRSQAIKGLNRLKEVSHLQASLKQLRRA